MSKETDAKATSAEGVQRQRGLLAQASRNSTRHGALMLKGMKRGENAVKSAKQHAAQ